MFPEPVKITPVAKTINLADVIHQIKKPETTNRPEHEKAAPVKVKTIAIPSKIVVTDDAVLLPPTINDVKDAVISPLTQDGEIQPDLVTSANDVKGTEYAEGTLSGTSSGNEAVDLPSVDEYPDFEGGMKAWAKYIQRNLRYPDQALEANLEGRVFLSFVVEKDGSVSNVTLIRGIGVGL